MKVPRQTGSFSCCCVKVTVEYTKSHFEQTANKCLLAYRCGKRSGRNIRNSEKGRVGEGVKGRGDGKEGTREDGWREGKQEGRREEGRKEGTSEEREQGGGWRKNEER